jgi:hypothetical protein
MSSVTLEEKFKEIIQKEVLKRITYLRSIVWKRSPLTKKRIHFIMKKW